VSGHLDAPAALPKWKSHTVPIGQEAVWAPEPVWTLWRREKSYPAENISRALQLVVHRYIDSGKGTYTLVSLCLFYQAVFPELLKFIKCIRSEITISKCPSRAIMYKRDFLQKP
jgi:hypothetical protein